jgi:hypothetical protein
LLTDTFQTTEVARAHVGADAFVRPASEASAPDECVRGHVLAQRPVLDFGTNEETLA